VLSFFGLLQEKMPLAVGIVCQSHSLSLGLKHFAMEKHCPNVAAAFESANLVVNCILENARIRWLVNQKQVELYGKVGEVVGARQQRRSSNSSRSSIRICSSSSGSGSGSGSSRAPAA
jgi:hypothetical protein